MTLTYRSSVLFSQPSTYTITHMDIQDALYHHKRKLQINLRSKQNYDNYKTQRLSSSQARTIENLSKKTRTYSLNTLLKTYNKGFDIQLNNNNMVSKSTKNQFKKNSSHNFYFKSKLLDQLESKQTICPQKLKLFRAGVNYRSTQRVRGAGVKPFNAQDLKQYFNRCPEEQIQLTKTTQNNDDRQVIQKIISKNTERAPFRKYNTIDYTDTDKSRKSSFRSTKRSKF